MKLPGLYLGNLSAEEHFSSFWDTRLIQGGELGERGTGGMLARSRRGLWPKWLYLLRAGLKLKGVFHPPSSVTGEGEASTKTPFWVLVKKGRMQARSWVLTNPDSRLKSHLAHTQNAWFTHSGWGWGCLWMYSRSVFKQNTIDRSSDSASSLLTTLLDQLSMPVCVQHWISHHFTQARDNHETLIAGSCEYRNMTPILYVGTLELW